MIHGIGTDIVAIQRLDELHARYGGRLAERILAPEEQAEYAAAGNKETFLAKRFAAKEAFAKAAGTGMRTPVHFGALRVTHDPLGRPGLTWGPELSDWLARQGIGTAHLSLSDERDYAVAFVVLEKA
jgi:holo-[acyl-carrier protein] synthase